MRIFPSARSRSSTSSRFSFSTNLAPVIDRSPSFIPSVFPNGTERSRISTVPPSRIIPLFSPRVTLERNATPETATRPGPWGSETSIPSTSTVPSHATSGPAASVTR